MPGPRKRGKTGDTGGTADGAPLGSSNPPLPVQAREWRETLKKMSVMGELLMNGPGELSDKGKTRFLSQKGLHHELLILQTAANTAGLLIIDVCE